VAYGHLLCLLSRIMSCLNLAGDLTKVLEPLLAQEGFDLVDLDWRPEQAGWVLRIYLDRLNSATNAGVTIADCEKMSHTVGDYLDGVDWIHHRYQLEVSSPGLYRVLRRAKDFVRFQGQRVRVELKESLPGSIQRVYVSWIDHVKGDCVVLSQGGKDAVSISLDNIAKANLDPIIEV